MTVFSRFILVKGSLSAWGDVSGVRRRCGRQSRGAVWSRGPLYHLTVRWAYVTIHSRYTLWAGSSVTLNHSKSPLRSIRVYSLSKWNSKEKKKWHQIFPCATLWLSNSLSTGVLVLILQSGIHCCICGHLSFTLWSCPPYEFKKALLNLISHCIISCWRAGPSCSICSNKY